MKRKAIKKVISVLLPMLTLLILSSCNNGVDNDLANAAISNIRSVVEAAGLKRKDTRQLIRSAIRDLQFTLKELKNLLMSM